MRYVVATSLHRVRPNERPRSYPESLNLRRGNMEPTLIINPSSDQEFTAFVHECTQAASDTDTLQECLRARYPRSVARMRALSGERASVWYVYRDGRWVAPDSEAEATI